MLATWERTASLEETIQVAMAQSRTLRLPTVSSYSRVPPGFQTYLDKRYHKVVHLIDFIAAADAVGGAAVVEACEVFASGGSRQWLKVAGAAKAEIIDRCLDQQPEDTVVAEFGAFVGYSAVRMASQGTGPVMSFESDAIHVLVARHLIVRAQQVAEVLPGMAHDVMPRLVEDWGTGGTGFAFMDHRGTRFHAELRQLEALGAQRPGSQVLCDNTLKPGAPVLLWNLLFRHTALSVSLPEFQAEECEDWMTATDSLEK